MYIIYSGGIYFSLSCDKTIYEDIIKSNFLREYIPSFIVINDKSNPNLSIKIILGKEPGIKKINSFSFIITYNTNTSTEDIITLIEYCCCFFREKIGIYSVHGTAACYNNIGIWLRGPISGIGKTSTAINLCNLGFSFIGDENIYISHNGYITEGVKKICFNKPISPKYLKSSNNAINNSITFNEKKIPTRIIIQPIICEAGKLECISWDKTKKKFHLYEELSRRIRGCSRLINNWSIPIQSIDNKELSRKRIEFCSNLANIVEAYTIKGSMLSVTNKIQNLVLHLGQ